MYSIPARKEILLIASYSPNTALDSPKPSEHRIGQKEEIERIRRDTRRKLPKTDLKWTIRIIPEDDFLKSIPSLEYKNPATTNQSFDNSESMELLAINLLKTPRPSNDLSCNTPKILSKVPNEDIIEVFI